MKIFYWSFWRDFLTHPEVKRILIWSVIGGVIQILARRFVETHPEYYEKVDGRYRVRKPQPQPQPQPQLEPQPEIKNKKRRFPNFFPPRGGAIIEGVTVMTILQFLSEGGLLSAFISSIILRLNKIPADAISTYLRDSFQQNLPEFEAKKFILVDGGKISLDQPCDSSLEYLFDVLKDATIVPFEEKEKLTSSTFTYYSKMRTGGKWVGFVLCMVFILSIFATTDPASYHILLKNLIEAIKEGKIPKRVGRIIVRRLKKEGFGIHPDLLEITAT